MQTFQYIDPRGIMIALGTKWVAAPSIENADAYALAHGWIPGGGVVFDTYQTARMLDYGPAEAGIDVVLQVRDGGRYTGPERRS